MRSYSKQSFSGSQSKDEALNRISSLTELAFVPRRPNGQFPGLFIFTGAARMMRPVLNLAMNTVEWIGKFARHHTAKIRINGTVTT